MPLFRRRRPSAPLPDDWEDVVAGRSPAWWAVPVAVRTAARDVIEHLLATKRWEAAAGFDLTDEVRLVIASQAALPVALLAERERQYPNVRSIIVHADAIPAGEREGPVEGTWVDDEEWSSGEAGHDDEPITLAWADVVWDLRHHRSGKNVVIHEFAHKLDMLDGTVDGTPPMAADLRARWIDVCTREFEAVQELGDDHVLGDYAGEDPGEFFSVASEVFFTRPDALVLDAPELYVVLTEYFTQDPARWPTA
ncbi:MAG TPA: M90 family metallopeptidase [Acidimicrobiales bacterium]|nr:M90 family metallopeptidase [Acidimicrobiales bacterium]